jgi:2-keto-4-pentenoate hydratase/2-oxohepta-3-ene-1,7-dioic acid hydratase in catechol pathway
MRLACVVLNDGPQAAVVSGDEVAVLSEVDPSLPADVAEILAGGDELLDRVRAAVSNGGPRRALADVHLTAPVRPGKFLAIGLNYADHVAETGADTPEFPTVFAKMPSCVVGPFDAVERPRASDQVDYEGELGLVIGRRCRDISRDEAPDVIAGYTVINDVSVRDYQHRTSQWVLGKSFDTHGPIGPWIVTADEIDPHALDLRTFVNGEVRQESNTSNLIFDCYAIVELLSSVCTLEPGDVIATGTPGGVGSPTKSWLKGGDTVRVEIDGIGAIENPIVEQAAPERAM